MVSMTLDKVIEVQVVEGKDLVFLDDVPESLTPVIEQFLAIMGTGRIRVLFYGQDDERFEKIKAAYGSLSGVEVEEALWGQDSVIKKVRALLKDGHTVMTDFKLEPWGVDPYIVSNLYWIINAPSDESRIQPEGRSRLFVYTAWEAFGRSIIDIAGNQALRSIRRTDSANSYSVMGFEDRYGRSVTIDIVDKE